MNKIRLIYVLLSLAILLKFAGVSSAAAFTVTNLNDSGPGSLRQAILDADAAAGADTIDFSVAGTITLASTLPNINDPAGLTIDGGGAITISGNHAVRVFYVAGGSLTLQNLTVANGQGPSDLLATWGGGLYNDAGTVSVIHTTFSGNSASGDLFGLGGGIFNTGGTLSVANSTFSGNGAEAGTVWGLGGAIANGDTVTDFSLPGGPLTISNSTFSGNSADFGGGLYHGHAAGGWAQVVITNSTFSGNGAVQGGGAIYTAPPTITLANTILANSPAGGDCAGEVGDAGGNLVEDGSCGFPVGGDPLLAPLALNAPGGTETHALLPGSPAIDSGLSTNCLATDQRGVPRPQGAGYDIGAFELEQGAPPPVGALYPIALHTQSLEGVPVGGAIPDVYNGVQPGNFGWLTWAGDTSAGTLITSLTAPGDSDTYTNPYDPSDHTISPTDWVSGRPGVTNNGSIQSALNQLIGMDISLPVWDLATQSGSNTLYHIADFAVVRLLDYSLVGQDRFISAQFLGYGGSGGSGSCANPSP